MVAPNEKLAESLDVLNALYAGGVCGLISGVEQGRFK
jgi:hypothetical protein